MELKYIVYWTLGSARPTRLKGLRDVAYSMYYVFLAMYIIVTNQIIYRFNRGYSILLLSLTKSDQQMHNSACPLLIGLVP